jgi:hypothetical protein
MDPASALKLRDMISENNVEDITHTIRDKKHSDRIKRDVDRMIELKKLHNMTNPPTEEEENILVAGCSFLYSNYTDIFIKIKKDEIDLKMFGYFLTILKGIEEGDFDQHTGAYEIGKVLKNIYIDSAKRVEQHANELESKNAPPPPDIIDISWTQFKNKIE